MEDPANNDIGVSPALAAGVVAIALLGAGGWLWWFFQGTSAGVPSSAPPGAVTRNDSDGPVATKPPGVVYESHFDGASPIAGPGWTMQNLAWSPNKKVRFLGPVLSRSPLLFTVDGLPPHRFMRVRFELITGKSWDGDSPYWGQCIFDLRVAGGQPLIHTTFCNCGFFTDNNEQSFPDQYPWSPTHPAWTGAAQQQSLGYMQSWGGPDRTFGVDSTYDFDLAFPHAGETLTLKFLSDIQRSENKPFGVVSMKAETLDHAAVADEATIAGWWADLADEDAVKAYKAVWSLVATGDAATRYIGPRLSVVDAAHAPPATTQAPAGNGSMMRWKYGSVVCDTPDERQRARAMHVLEAINSEASAAVRAAAGRK